MVATELARYTRMKRIAVVLAAIHVAFLFGVFVGRISMTNSEVERVARKASYYIVKAREQAEKQINGNK